MKILGLIALLSVVFWIRIALASDVPREQAIRCVMGEARGEPYKGQVAVAEVLRRRGSTIGMYGCSYTDWTEKEWSKAELAWEESASTNYSKEATNFESTDFKKPYWSKDMDLVVTIGKHQFFRKR